MIIAIYAFTLLNFFSASISLPSGFRTVFYIAQFVCVIIATAIWESWKVRVEALEEKHKERRIENDP